jgi:hypothetical protein
MTVCGGAGQLAGLQLLANAAVGQESVQAVIWEGLFPEILLRLVGCSDGKVSAAACAVLNQCTVHSPSRSQSVATDSGAALLGEMVARVHMADADTFGIEWPVCYVLSLGCFIMKG